MRIKNKMQPRNISYIKGIEDARSRRGKIEKNWIEVWESASAVVHIYIYDDD